MIHLNHRGEHRQAARLIGKDGGHRDAMTNKLSCEEELIGSDQWPASRNSRVFSVSRNPLFSLRALRAARDPIRTPRVGRIPPVREAHDLYFLGALELSNYIGRFCSGNCRIARLLFTQLPDFADRNGSHYGSGALSALPERYDGLSGDRPRCKACGRITGKPTGALPRHLFCLAERTVSHRLQPGRHVRGWCLQRSIAGCLHRPLTVLGLVKP
jgi:hypothetical protein